MNLLAIKNALSNWFPESSRVSFPISVDEPLIIKYRMTLGSVYYSSEKHGIVTVLPEDPHLDNVSLTLDFLKSHHLEVFRSWETIKRKTEQHLEYVSGWIRNIIIEVDDIISQMVSKYSSLVLYDKSKRQEHFYVRDHIILGLDREIEHIALTGTEIGLFQRSVGKIGNGYLFVQSSDEELLVQFMALFNKAIHNESLIDKFRDAETKKADVEMKVLDFKQELQKIIKLH